MCLLYGEGKEEERNIVMVHTNTRNIAKTRTFFDEPKLGLFLLQQVHGAILYVNRRQVMLSSVIGPALQNQRLEQRVDVASSDV